MRVGMALGALGLAIALGAGCASDPTALMHNRDRLNYAIQAAELEKLPVSISTEVLARDIAKGQSTESVIVIPAGTQGRVLEVGERWLRVSFDPAGTGIFFVSDPGADDDGYWLASQRGGDLEKVQRLPEKVLVIGERSYRIVHGAGAFLVVDRDDLEEIVERRPHASGR